MRQLNNLKISIKLPAIIVALVMMSAGGVSMLGFFSAQSILRNSEEKILSGLLQSVCKGLGEWADNVGSDVRLEAGDLAVQSAVRSFSRVWREVSDDPTQYLQDAYITNNPYTGEQRSDLDDANDGSLYSSIHARFHPHFRALAKDRGYHDILLFDTEGNIIYSVDKERDFITGIDNPLWANSGLAKVFRAANTAPLGEVIFSDFEPFQADHGAPIGFFASPIINRNGERMGVIAVLATKTMINNVINGADAALGETGEISLVGTDLMTRNDSRLPDLPGALERKMDTEQVRAALRGEKGQMISVNAEGLEVVATYDVVRIFGTTWALVAEQSVDEDDTIFMVLRNKIWLVLGVIGLAVGGLGLGLSRTISSPINRLALAVARVAERDYETKVSGLDRQDEIGKIARNLDELKEKLIKAEIDEKAALIKGAAFEGASSAMMTVDLDHIITYANESATKLFDKHIEDFRQQAPGFEVENLVGGKVDKFHHLFTSQQGLLSDPDKLPFTADMTIGGIRIELRASGIRDDEGNHIGVALGWENVTERRLSSGVMAAINRNQATAEYTLEGEFVAVNEVFQNMFGYTQDDLIGRSRMLVVHASEGKDGGGEATLKRLLAGEIVAGKFHRVAKDGSEIWIEASYNLILDSNEQPYRIVEIASDVTEMEQIAFDRLAIIEAIGKSQTLVELAPDGIILTANENFLKLTGYEEDEIIGKPHNIFVDDEVAECPGYKNLWNHLAEGKFDAGIFRRVDKNGDRIYLQVSYNPVLGRDGEVTKIVETAVDITEDEMNKLQQQNERALMQSEQKQVVEALNIGLAALSDGDLTIRLQDAFAGQYEQLRLNFNEAVGSLQDAIQSLFASANGIQSGASEISQAAEELSRRTEGQAATLEQTAAALDELTISVKSAADGAEKANSVVSSARADAESGGDVVREAVVAMGEIEKSSEKISQIIGVIDDIAFQTNLLALNAGVEAARAGEAGRGFAVVASEVRALAQRSSDAAKEIKALILNSSNQVEQGVELVGQAGTALQQIVESVALSNSLVSQIAASAKEQAIGLTEINTGVNQLDNVTQQNAAMVEETTAASLTMHKESEALTRLVERFEIGNDRQDQSKIVDLKSKKSRGSRGQKPAAPAGRHAQAVNAVADVHQDWEDF